MICVNSVKVTPESVTLKAGQWYYNARAEVCPLNATNQTIAWSSDEEVAEVGMYTGELVIKSAGTATITATC